MTTNEQKKTTKPTAFTKALAGPPPAPARSLAIASEGVQTGAQFARLMSNLMADLLDGRITPQIGNAVCNAGGKLLKVVEMQHKWGTQKTEGGPRDLQLTA